MEQLILGDKKYNLSASLGVLRRACGRVKMDIMDFYVALTGSNFGALYAISYEMIGAEKTMTYEQFEAEADALTSMSQLMNPVLAAFTSITKTKAAEVDAEKKS